MTAHHVNRLRWQMAPCALLCVPFLLGMTVQSVLGGPVLIWSLLVGTMVIAGLRYHRKFHLSRLSVLLLLMALMGCLLVLRNQQPPTWMDDQPHVFRGTIQTIAPTSHGCKARVLLHERDGSALSQPQQIRVLAYLPHCSAELGDTLTFAEPLSTFPDRGPAWAFDAASFYWRQGIARRVFLQEGAFSIRPCTTFHLRRWGARMQESIRSRLSTSLKDPASKAIALAMVAGDRTEINDATRDAFARAGAIHIMAISGLHIGIVASLLIWLIGRPRRGAPAWSLALRFAVILAGIWGFTLASGLSPSAVRAAFMFSMYAIGVIAGRNSSGLNILGFCCMVSLILQPGLLYSVSFQFSYLALAGILIFGGPLFRAIPARPGVLRYLWGIAAISIAAQLPLIPASVHYFNQFSVISPLISLVAIPAAFGIVTGGIILTAAASIWPAAGTWIGGILDAGIGALNRLVTATSQLEWSAATELYLPAHLLPVAYLVVAGVALRVLTGRRGWTRISVIAILGFLVLSAHHQMTQRNTQSLVIYNSEMAFQVDWCARSLCYSTIDAAETGFIRTDVRRHRLSRFVRSRHVHQLPFSPGLSTVAQVGSWRVGYWPGGDPPDQPLDILHVGAGVAKEVSSRSNWPDAPTIVVARTFPGWAYRTLRKHYIASETRFHHLRYDGHFEIINKQTPVT
ncbi:MAG: ComEC/Rec2 family competence protein [Saprospiraceae bacterium]|nr:ComEC/Rec2 family competence protein [Saprospiraceae bacterium]